MKSLVKNITVAIILILGLSINTFAAEANKSAGEGKKSKIYREGSIKDLSKMAKDEEKPILIFVNDKSCMDCAKMDSILQNSSVGQYLSKNFIVKNLDASKYYNLYKATNWGVTQVPSYVFMNSKGQVVHLASGFMEQGKMMNELQTTFKKMTDSNNKLIK